MCTPSRQLTAGAGDPGRARFATAHPSSPRASRPRRRPRAASASAARPGRLARGGRRRGAEQVTEQTAIADSLVAVLLAVREQLLEGRARARHPLELLLHLDE